MRLRYTGQQATSFMAFPYLGEIEPGDFDARNEDTEALLRRADVEAAAEPTASPDADPEPEAAVAKPRRTAASKAAAGA